MNYSNILKTKTLFKIKTIEKGNDILLWGACKNKRGKD